MAPELFYKNLPETQYVEMWVLYHPWLPDVYQILGNLLNLNISM